MQSSCTSERTALFESLRTLCPQSHSLPPKPRGWMQEDGQAVLLPGRPQEAQGLRGLASQEAVLMRTPWLLPAALPRHLWRPHQRESQSPNWAQNPTEGWSKLWKQSGGGEGMPRQPVRALDFKRRFLQLLTWATALQLLGQEGHMASSSSGL